MALQWRAAKFSSGPGVELHLRATLKNSRTSGLRAQAQSRSPTHCKQKMRRCLKPSTSTLEPWNFAPPASPPTPPHSAGHRRLKIILKGKQNEAESNKTSRKTLFLSCTDINLDKRLFTSCKEEEASLIVVTNPSPGPDCALKYLSILPQETCEMLFFNQLSCCSQMLFIHLQQRTNQMKYSKVVI